MPRVRGAQPAPAAHGRFLSAPHARLVTGPAAGGLCAFGPSAHVPARVWNRAILAVRDDRTVRRASRSIKTTGPPTRPETLDHFSLSPSPLRPLPRALGLGFRRAAGKPTTAVGSVGVRRRAHAQPRRRPTLSPLSLLTFSTPVPTRGRRRSEDGAPAAPLAGARGLPKENAPPSSGVAVVPLCPRGGGSSSRCFGLPIRIGIERNRCGPNGGALCRRARGPTGESLPFLFGLGFRGRDYFLFDFFPLIFSSTEKI